MNTAKLKKQGRSFNCATCDPKIKKIRRCQEDREDFTAEDGALWPMYIQEGGELYGFCPAKATWDLSLSHHFSLMVIIAQTGTMPYEGGLYDQPAELIEELAWFLPRYEQMKFIQKADMILGGDTSKKMKTNKLARAKRT